MPRTAATLQKAWTRIDRWRLAANDHASLASGLARLYRRGRKALARVEADTPTDDVWELIAFVRASKRGVCVPPRTAATDVDDDGE